MTLLNTYWRVPNATPLWCTIRERHGRICVVRTDKRSFKVLERETKERTEEYARRHGTKKGREEDNPQATKIA